MIRIVPTTRTKITASMTAYSAMSWPSSLHYRWKNKLDMGLLQMADISTNYFLRLRTTLPANSIRGQLIAVRTVPASLLRSKVVSLRRAVGTYTVISD